MGGDCIALRIGSPGNRDRVSERWLLQPSVSPVLSVYSGQCGRLPSATGASRPNQRARDSGAFSAKHVLPSPLRPVRRVWEEDWTNPLRGSRDFGRGSDFAEWVGDKHPRLPLAGQLNRETMTWRHVALFVSQRSCQ